MRASGAWMYSVGASPSRTWPRATVAKPGSSTTRNGGTKSVVIAKAHGQLRIVDQHRAGAGQDRAGARAPLLHVRARGFAADPLRVAGRQRAAPVDAGRQLDPQPGPAAFDPRQEAAIQRARLRFHQPGLDRDAGRLQLLETGAVDLRERIAHRPDHARDAGGDQRLRARPGAAGVRARFQGHVGGRAARARRQRPAARTLPHAARPCAGASLRRRLRRRARSRSRPSDSGGWCRRRARRGAARAPSSRGRWRRTSWASLLSVLVRVLVDGHHFAAEQRQLALARHVALEPVEFLAEIGHVLERRGTPRRSARSRRGRACAVRPSRTRRPGAMRSRARWSCATGAPPRAPRPRSVPRPPAASAARGRSRRAACAHRTARGGHRP